MFKGKSVVLILCAAGVVAFCGTGAKAQTTAAKAGPRAISSAADKSLYSEYRGIAIGVPTADVHTKLGKAKEASDTQEQFIFSDNESVQFYYDAGHKVNAIVITFQGDVSKAPTAKDVFGEDVPPSADGTVFKMARYPKAGYWISYTRTTGSDAMVNIAMQKM